MLALLDGVGGQTDPLDFLLLLGDDVHCHQDIQSIVHATPDVLVVNRLQSERYSVVYKVSSCNHAGCGFQCSIVAKEWKSGAPLHLSIPFSFDVVARM